MTPKFPPAVTSLHHDLKTRVAQYFKDTNIETRGDSAIYTKAAIIVGGMIALYIHLVFFTPPGYVAIPECVLLGLFITGTGFNVMHDGSHESFSARPWMNTLAAGTLECLGGSAYIWKAKHCIIHHTFTNVEGVDDDINIGILMRVNQHQKRYWAHRFQQYYCWLLYMTVYVVWIMQVDYQRYFTGRVGPVPMAKMRPADHFKFWIGKLVNACLFFVIPIYRLGWQHAVLGFAVTTLTAGIILTIVFQLAHTVEGPEFPLPSGSNLLPDEFAVHQIATTANFATRSRAVTWMCGGLNFQIEHHLFPRIAHTHYPALSRIVREICEERGIPYVEHTTFASAVAAHLRHLKALGQPGPDPTTPFSEINIPQEVSA